MAKVRSSNTAFEEAVFCFLRSKRIRFKAHGRDIPGKPDIVIFSRKKAAFLDSDFWHGWRYPVWKEALKSDFWKKKIEANRRRDKLVKTKLRRRGWSVLRIWEHQLGKDFEGTVNRIARFLKV